MSHTALTVITTITAKPGLEADLGGTLRALLEPTRREAGCLACELHEALERPGRFLLRETWESQDAFDAHLKSAHLAAALRRLPDLADGTADIQLWRQVT